MIYTPEMMRTLARQHDEDSDTRAALMQAADNIESLHAENKKLYAEVPTEVLDRLVKRKILKGE